MKTSELQMMDDEELEDNLEEVQMELMKSNAQIALGSTPENPGKVKALKKTVAKIKTLLNEREEE